MESETKVCLPGRSFPKPLGRLWYAPEGFWRLTRSPKDIRSRRAAGRCSAAGWISSVMTTPHTGNWRGLRIVRKSVPSAGKRQRIETRFAGVFSAAILLLAACRSPATEPSMSVYVMDEFARVRPRDAPGSKRVAVLSAARNEYAPFQIIVRAGTGGLRRVNAVAGPLVPKRGRAIPADRITLYREHYVEVRKLSPKSKSAPGWYPDALIPFLDPSTGKPPVRARFAAAPFDIAPDSNQPLWVDVLTPRDATPGEYAGMITISAEGIGTRRVPIELNVWDFTLPETSSMRTLFGDADVNPLLSSPAPEHLLERRG